ncbi:hypothetical protein AOLI_G00120870 [Acnodon oligacanthus]
MERRQSPQFTYRGREEAGQRALGDLARQSQGRPGVDKSRPSEPADEPHSLRLLRRAQGVLLESGRDFDQAYCSTLLSLDAAQVEKKLTAC